MIDLLTAAAELQGFCDAQGWRSCFTGGIAVQRWGEPRVRRDLDMTLLTGFGGEGAFVDRFITRFRCRVRDAREFSVRQRVLLLETTGGTGIEISLGAPVRRASRPTFLVVPHSLRASASALAAPGI